MVVASAFRWKKPAARTVLRPRYGPPVPSSQHASAVHRTTTQILTFCTDQRSRFFVQEAPVALVRAQILRAAREERFELSAYCFMPDHVHLIASGLDESSDAKAFISRSKQYSG